MILTKKKTGRKAKAREAIPYHRPFLDTDDLRLVREVLHSGWLTTGKIARDFEEDCCRYLNHYAALAVSSCTAALHLACELAGVKDRHVIVPTLTFTASAAAVEMAHGLVSFADVDPLTLTLSAKEADEAAQLNRLKPIAVMPVHYGGNPSGFTDVLELARHNQWHVIDDAAHAMPAKAEQTYIGAASWQTFATCFSFYPTKPITTGEGGLLLLQHPELLDRARRLSLHGISADAYQRSRGGLYHYSVEEHGYKYNLPDVLAALGRSQLKKAESFWQRRVTIATQYQQRFRDLQRRGQLTLPVVHPGCESSWHLYVVRFPVRRFAEGWSRDRMAERLKELGINTSMHYVPLHRHPYWRDRYGLNGDMFPNAEAAYQEILSLPIWVGMTEAMVNEVADRVIQVCQEGQR